MATKKEKERAQALREVALSDLEECNYGDPESGHVRADEALCALLRGLGFDDVVDAYEAVEKWYA